jgi:hypothetical protein
MTFVYIFAIAVPSVLVGLFAYFLYLTKGVEQERR